MDENRARALLERLAAGEPPPPRVDIAAARALGRRRRRRRRAGLSAVPLAGAAVAVALIVTGVIPAGPGLTGKRTGPAVPPAAVQPRTSFDVFAPYARFGWLPAGFTVAAGAAMGNQPAAAPQSVTISAGDQRAGRLITLTVSAAGACKITGPKMALIATAGRPGIRQRVPHELDCGYPGGTSGLPLTKTAPEVNGRPGYWSATGWLVWEYAPGSWAELIPGIQPLPGPAVTSRGLAEQHRRAEGWVAMPARTGHYPATVQSATARGLLLRIAAHIRYGGGTRLLFPFRLSDVPPGWRVAGTYFSEVDGRLAGTSLDLGPASEPSALTVGASPASAGADGCSKFIPGQSEYLTVDGVQAMLRTISEVDKHEQDLCIASLHGLSVEIWLQLNAPGSNKALPGLVRWLAGVPATAGPRGVMTVFHHLHLLGSDPANWTSHPLG